jgi:stearoyl-CoA desaturase (delta-9 desaturase)
MRSEITKKTGIHWLNLIVLTVFHILAGVALFFFSWQNLFVTLFIWWLSGGFGIGVGYHRLLTHRGFKTSRWMQNLLTFCGTLALESGPIQWVATHRMHHAFVEVPGKDPHTPRDGIFWAHAGWILQWPAQTHDQATLQRYVPDLLKDPVQVFLSNYYYLSNILLGAGLLYFGGIGMVLWAVFLRITLGLHFTWMVNSVTHLWGTRPFETNDDSRNNFLVALVSFGEGWHNHHHAYPRAARHGLRWYQIDVNWYTITVMRWLGLARDIKLITPAQIAAPRQVAAEELRQAA